MPTTSLEVRGERDASGRWSRIWLAALDQPVARSEEPRVSLRIELAPSE